jgi:glycosyltransferase involved in cell wall biosynthesis
VIRGLDSTRFRPVLICLHELGELGEALSRQGVTVHERVAGHSLDPRNVIRLAGILKSEQADFLYVTDGFHNMVAGRLAASLARTPQSVLIFHSYDTIIRKSLSPARRAMLGLSDRLFHPHFAHIVSLSKSHKEYLHTEKGIPRDKISIVYNGIDDDRYNLKRPAAEVRSKYGLPAKGQVVAMIAGLRRWKSHGMLLRAAVTVLRQAPDTVFVLAGDGPERERLERLATELGIDSNVHFLGRVENVPELLAAVDVSVLSSVHEAFPLSLLESMAASIPMVATDVGSVSEIVEDGVNGFLVESGAEAAFADGILRLVREPELARRLGANGRKKLEAHFTLRQMVSSCEALFSEWWEELQPTTGPRTVNGDRAHVPVP